MTAQCSLHPEEVAAASCTRCGRFCCQTCVVNREPPLCYACAGGVTDPFDVRSRRLDAMHGMITALRLVRAELAAVLIITLIFSIPASLLHLALETAQSDDLTSTKRSIQLDNAFDGFIAIIGTQAIVLLFLARLEGRRLSLGQALREGSLRWGRGVGTNIRAGLWTLLFFILLIIPGVWKSVMLTWASIAAMRVREDPLEYSQNLVRGRFWPTFGYVLVSLVPVLIAAGISIGVSTLLEVFEAPRPFGIIGTFLMDFVVRFADDVVSAAIMVCGFVMVHRDANETLPAMQWSVAEPPLADQSLSRST